MENGPRHTLQIGSDCPGVKGESSGEKIEDRVEVVCAAVPNSILLKINSLSCFLKYVVGVTELPPTPNPPMHKGS